MAPEIPVISLTTDFGLEDAYTGILKAVILSICAKARLVDLTHNIPAFDVGAAAWILANAYPHFPAGTVHLAVVDPQVGSQQRGLLIVADNHLFVGPDNGIFSQIVRHKHPVKVYELVESRFWRKPVSTTFHARDIYGPVAAQLACGQEPESVGPPLSADEIILLPEPAFIRKARSIVAEVVYEDSFGNLVTNIPADLVPQDACVSLESVRIGCVSRSYFSAGRKGQLVAIFGSHGFLEIGAFKASASKLAKAGRGSCVSLSWDGDAQAVEDS